MVLKHRCGWGYETLMREVSDSIHLRRFCRLGLTERVPDESTVRKLTRRLGAEVVHQLTRELIGKARREKRFRPRAARIDSTVVEADIRYPTDSGLAADGIRALAREGRKLATKIGAKRTAVRDRSRAAGRRLRALTRSMRRRSGQAKEEVLELTRQTGRLLATFGHGDAAARRGGQAAGARARRPGQAQGRASARGARRPLREGGRADHQARQGREDHRPADLAVGPGRPADPQGQTLDSPTNSAMSISCARSPPTPNGVRAGSSSRPQARSATRARTRYSPTPQPSCRTSTSSCGR